MDDNMEKTEVEETNESDVSAMSNDELKVAIEGTLEKIRRQSMLLGAQAICSVVLQKILELEHKQGKITMNDYKRLVKDVKGFCQTGLSRKVNEDATTSEKTEDNSEE